MEEGKPYQSLMQDDDVSIDEIDFQKKITRRSSRFLRPDYGLKILLILLAVSLTTNVIQAWHSSTVERTSKLSRYLKLPYINAQWLSTSNAEAQSKEDLLEAISFNDGAIAVSKEWADENNLGETSVFPWDESKRLYFIHAYHGLHCVKMIYRFAKATSNNSDTQSVPLEHVIHCLDSMRKDIMCYADDTPRPRKYQVNSTVAIKAVGEPRQCRDWSALEIWAKEKNACFRTGNANPDDMLHSQLKFCPDESPYLPAVRKYYGQGEDWYPQDM